MFAKSIKPKITTILQGFVMGIAEIIPGVSGSTLALTMGIYDDFINLLNQISEVVKTTIRFIIRRSSFSDILVEFKKVNFKFGTFLVLGMVLAIVLLSNIMHDLLDTHRQYLYAFFFGLIFASIYIPFKELKSKTLKEFSIFLISFIVGFIVLGITPSAEVTNPSPIYLLLGGFLGISAMVLPGVSGSFVLLLLGLYEYILGVLKSITKLSASSQDVINLAIFMIGLVLGFTIFVRFIKLAFHNFSSFILSFLMGLMLASARVLWPFIQNIDGTYVQKLPWELQSQELVIIFALIIVSALAVLLLSRMNVKEIEKI